MFNKRSLVVSLAKTKPATSSEDGARQSIDLVTIDEMITSQVDHIALVTLKTVGALILLNAARQIAVNLTDPRR